MRRAHLIDLSLLLLLTGPLVAAEPSKFTLPVSAAVDPLTVIGPASVCADQQIALWSGASNTSLQCSVLTVADTTGNLTGPSGGFSIIGGTGGSSTLTLDGDPSVAGRVTIGPSGTVAHSGTVDPGFSSAGYTGFILYKNGTTNSIVSISDWSLSYPGIQLPSNGGALWSDATTGGSMNIGLGRDAASGTLAQRFPGIAQTFRIYGLADFFGTFTNYERLSLSCDGTADCTISTETAGTGTDNIPLTLVTAGAAGVLSRRHITPDIDGETTTALQSGTVWTNTGDGDGEAITLLNDPTIGVQYCFAVDAAQTITVAPSTGESLYYGTDQCVVSLTSNAVGSTLCVTAISGGSGAKWFTMSHEGSWTCND